MTGKLGWKLLLHWDLRVEVAGVYAAGSYIAVLDPKFKKWFAETQVCLVKWRAETRHSSVRKILQKKKKKTPL